MISTKGRYALRVMIDLAEHEKDGLVPLKDISDRQGISKKYLEIIVRDLVRTDLIEGFSGKGGGYRLNRSPDEYTVGSILKLTEGGISAVSCTSQGAAACSRTECCQAKPMWDKLDKMIDDFFEGITIGDLLKEVK